MQFNYVNLFNYLRRKKQNSTNIFKKQIKESPEINERFVDDFAVTVPDT